MSWREDDQFEDSGWRRFGRPGGDWSGFRPSLDNPMSWSLPLMRTGGISVRVHLLFVAFVIIELARSFFPGSGQTFSWLSPQLAFVLVACLFIIVLTHEFGHCLACRWTGGAADEILMWPLGGLAMCRPVNNWKSHFYTAAGGPAVNVLFCVVCGTMLGLLTGKWFGVALPSPFDPVGVMLTHGLTSNWPLMILFLFNWCNLILLLFNLLPIFPMDGGRLFQTLMWPRVGYGRSMRMALRLGYVGAICLGLWGAIINEWLLLGIAIFGGVTCYITHKQLEFTEQIMDDYSGEVTASVYETSVEASGPTRAEKRAARLAEAAAQEAEQVDQILAKIKQSGMESLSGRERKLLKRYSDRQREG